MHWKRILLPWSDLTQAADPEQACQTITTSGKRFPDPPGRKAFALRLCAAALTASAMFLGISRAIEFRIQHSQSWEKVYTDGQYIGLVPDRSTLTDGMKRVAAGYGLSVSFAPVHTVVPPAYNWHRVAALPVDAAVIQANGRPLVYTEDRATAARVLHEVRQALTPAGVHLQSVRFQDDVQVKPAVVGVSRVLPEAAAVRYILHPDVTRLAGRAEFIPLPIRSRHPARTQPSSVHPLVDVTAVGSASRVVHVPFQVRYIDDNRLPRGQVKVVREGSPGQVQEQVQIHFIDGRPVQQTVVRRTVLRAPQPEIAQRGTNDGIAQGNWVWPTDSHVITSGFGPRVLGGVYEFHPGIDIGCPLGSPVYATNNGVVQEAGWNSGGYGNWVLIDNGGGLQTVFGHLSRVLVHAGQLVAKGQLIGYSGETGEATGPHLHYEVRLNGRAISPTPYM